jgi:protein O-mannosyl-transferase
MQTEIVSKEKKKNDNEQCGVWLWLERRRENYILPVLSLIAIAVFANTLGHNFVYDDHYLIEWNHALHDWRYFTKLFVESHSYDVPWLNMDAMSLDYYRPFTRMLFALAFQAFGLRTTCWHLLSVSIFTGIVLLAFVVMKQMSKSRAVAIVGSLLFIVHPIHSEAVSWINCLVELLHALFFLGAFVLYFQIQIESEDAKRNRIFFIGSVTLFIAALFSKETALCFPILVGAYKFIHTEKGIIRRVKAATWSAMPYLLVVVFYMVWRFFVYGGSLRVGSKLPMKMTFLTIPSVILEYIRMLFYPVGLSVVHSLPIISDPSNPRFWLPLLLLVSAGILIWLRAPRRAVFACAWVIITMLPALNIGRFIPELIVQDRYTFLPSLGFCFIVAMVFDSLIERSSPLPRLRPALITAISIMLIIFLALTIRQNRFWYSDQTLFHRAVVVNPKSEFARCSYGWALFYSGKKEDAARHFTTSFQVKNGKSGCGCLGLANYYADLKNYDQAILFYEQAIELQEAKLNLLVFVKLAELYNEKGEKEKAIELLTKAVAANPKYSEARVMLEKITGPGDTNRVED